MTKFRSVGFTPENIELIQKKIQNGWNFEVKFYINWKKKGIGRLYQILNKEPVTSEKHREDMSYFSEVLLRAIKADFYWFSFKLLQFW